MGFFERCLFGGLLFRSVKDLFEAVFGNSAQKRGSGRSFETDLHLRAVHLVFELDHKYYGKKTILET